MLDVLGDHAGEVERVDVVGRHDEQEVRLEGADVRLAPEDRVGVPLVEAALAAAEVRMEHPHAAVRAVEVPGAAVGQVLRERVRLVLQDDPDVGDAAVSQVREREVDQPVDAGERHRRLRALLGEDVEPAALAACEDERQDAGTPQLHPSSSSRSSSIPKWWATSCSTVIRISSSSTDGSSPNSSSSGRR